MKDIVLMFESLNPGHEFVAVGAVIQDKCVGHKMSY